MSRPSGKLAGVGVDSEDRPMGAYRFIAFPRGQQPTVEEVNLLTGYAPLLNRHVAWGRDRRGGGVAVAFEAEPFETALEADVGFEALIRCWQNRGCQVVESLDYVKDRDALHPIPIGRLPGAEHAAPASELTAAAHALDHVLIAKQRVAQDALGRAKLALDRTLQRHLWLRRFASVMPYILMVVAVAGLFAAGWYVTARLANGPRERRQETIQRVAEDGMNEQLAAGPRDQEPSESPPKR